jgi:chromosome segregation ATPase
MITNFSNETESGLKGTLHEKDDEISILKQEVEMANEKIQWAEEERQKTLEFLREQEAEIKKFKEKFYDIAQKASLQTQSQLEYT